MPNATRLAKEVHKILFSKSEFPIANKINPYAAKCFQVNSFLGIKLEPKSCIVSFVFHGSDSKNSY